MHHASTQAAACAVNPATGAMSETWLSVHVVSTLPTIFRMYPVCSTSTSCPPPTHITRGWHIHTGTRTHITRAYQHVDGTHNARTHAHTRTRVIRRCRCTQAHTHASTRKHANITRKHTYTQAHMHLRKQQTNKQTNKQTNLHSSCLEVLHTRKSNPCMIRNTQYTIP